MLSHCVYTGCSALSLRMPGFVLLLFKACLLICVLVCLFVFACSFVFAFFQRASQIYDGQRFSSSGIFGEVTLIKTCSLNGVRVMFQRRACSIFTHQAKHLQCTTVSHSWNEDLGKMASIVFFSVFLSYPLGSWCLPSLPSSGAIVFFLPFLPLVVTNFCPTTSVSLLLFIDVKWIVYFYAKPKY